MGFAQDLDVATIDKVQCAPDLLRAIKRSMDKDRRPGRFVLMGSANILAMPAIAESLAGRMEVVTLLPLCQAEILKIASWSSTGGGFHTTVTRISMRPISSLKMMLERLSLWTSKHLRRSLPMISKVCGRWRKRPVDVRAA